MAAFDSRSGYFCLMLKQHVAMFDIDGTFLIRSRFSLASTSPFNQRFYKIFAWLCLLPLCNGFQLKILLVSADCLKVPFPAFSAFAGWILFR